MAKSFVFSLDRMRDYKIQILNTEKNLLGTLIHKRDVISDKILELQAFRQQLYAQSLEMQTKTASMSELQWNQYCMENAAKQLKSLNIELINANAAVNQQREVVIKASQEVSGLDKLEEKQLEEYRLEVNRENATEINEQITGKLARKDSDAQMK